MRIGIINYSNSVRSAVYGLEEMFLIANTLSQNGDVQFEVDVIDLAEMRAGTFDQNVYSAILLPPSFSNPPYPEPDSGLVEWIMQKHSQGSRLCSACAGVFLIAATGLLENKEVTTHWNLVEYFKELHPKIKLNPNRIIINENDIITSGGMLAWIDLGLELIAQLSSPELMRKLGKILVVDTGQREQRYYQQFIPKFTHGDSQILDTQKKIQSDLTTPLKVSDLAEQLFLTERTFLRRFVKATGFKPSDYIQRLRVQKACDLLENSNKTFELIANDVGYENVSACRKTFVKIIGLTPREFKKRFTNH